MGSDDIWSWCIDWLERLERGEDVVMNLRPDTDDETEFVRFDRSRMLRVLSGIAGDLDNLARGPKEAVTPECSADEQNQGIWHRQRLAEPEPQTRRLSAQEERNALREALGHPPWEGR